MKLSRHRLKRIAGVSGMGLAVFFLVASRPAPLLLLNTKEIAAQPVLMSGCSVDSRCLSMEEHQMVSGSSFMYDAHSCAGPISHAGPACPGDGGGDGPIDPVGLEDVLTANPIKLAQMTEKPGTNVRWNQERNAIQMVDCYGQIVLHLPLSPEEASVFSD